MISERDIKRLKETLDIVNAQTPVHLRREAEFIEIKDLLSKYEPMKAVEIAPQTDWEDPYIGCPICNSYINCNLLMPFKVYCRFCGQYIIHTPEN